MSSFSRAVVLSLLLLIVFLGAALATQTWLHRETGRLREETARAGREALVSALAMAPRPPPAWDEEYRGRLASVVGGQIALVRADATPVPAGRGATVISIEVALDGSPDWKVRALIASPALERVQLMHNRALVGIVMLAGILVVIPIGLAIIASRSSGQSSTTTRSPWEAAKAHAAGMAHFARLTVERGDELAREQDARARVEQDLNVSQAQLNYSLAERVRLGRELHDNTCQTLFAVSLTLESVFKKIDAAPEIRDRLEKSIAELRRLNGEVRNYLSELEPASLKREPLSAALASLLAGLPAGGTVRIEQKFDPDVIDALQPRDTADIVNILREAISNGVRHGGAKNISVRAERSDDSVVIAVIDDGNGFDSAAPGARRGHGLANMEARAETLGGSLRVQSAPGNGTRVLLTLPVSSEA